MDFDTFIRATGIESYFSLLGSLLKADRPYRYTYVPAAQFGALNDLRERNRIYWYEILERAHCFSLVAVARMERWLASMMVTAEQDNFLGFAASFRGLLESAADTRFALGDVPIQLATTFGHAHDAVWNRSTIMVLAPDLEDDLIHFSHGRRVGKAESAPESHAAKTMREYLTALEGASTGSLFACYEELCGVTHPAADSVSYLLEKGNSGGIVFSVRPDEKAISDLCARGGTIVRLCVQQSLLYPIVNLRIINRFGLPELQTPVVEDVSLDSVPLWREVEAMLKSVGNFRQN